jgi:hypothetical protein
MSNKPKYIFIGGAGRSGTTLVQKILLGHPSISGGPEFYFTKPIFELLDRMLKIHSSNCFHPSIKKMDLEKLVRQFYDELLKGYGDDNTEYISEKTPSNIHVAEILLNSYPDSLFINVYRDGRAVLNSHFNVKKRGRENGKNLTEIGLVKTSVYWNRCIKEGFTAAKKFPGRVINISYEQLIQNPKVVLTNLFQELNLSSYSEMLNPENIQLKEGENKPHINNIWYTEEMYSNSFDTSKRLSWKKEMNIFRQYIATSIMYEQLIDLGFELKPVHQFGNSIFTFFYNWKSVVKSWRILYPLLYIKRRFL